MVVAVQVWDLDLGFFGIGDFAWDLAIGSGWDLELGAWI
jgi:hypothetical protein